MTEGIQRRLAAILAADVAGYSRLMGADEAGTLAALRQLRAELFGPTVAGHRGKVVKSMGDGWLVEFSSAVDAVNCALQVQERLAGHAIIKLRIGVHIGDIVHEDEDIFGDGVNVAARLQEFAEPGGVAISEPTYSSLDGTLAPAFDDAGPQELKNIARPVQIWMRHPRERAPASSKSSGATREAIGFPTLAIQPVQTSDERAEVRELADALTDDLLVYLGSSIWLDAAIVERPDTQTYVMRATLRGRGDRLRLEVKLNSLTGEPIWVGKYDGKLEDIFDWQDATGEGVTANVLGMVLDAEKRKLSAKKPDDMTAAECALYGLLHWSAVEALALEDSLRLFRLAISKDPNFGHAYTWAAMGVAFAKSVGYGDIVEKHLPHLEEWIDKAENLAGASSDVFPGLSFAKYIARGDPTTLEAEIEELLRKAPFDIQNLTLGGWGYVFLGQPQPALDCFRKSERLGRFSLFAAAASAGEAVAFIQAGRDEAAIGAAKRSIAKSPLYPAPHRALAAACAHLGRQEEASEAIAKLLTLVSDDSVSLVRERSGYTDNPATQRYFEGLRLAGLPEE